MNWLRSRCFRTEPQRWAQERKDCQKRKKQNPSAADLGDRSPLLVTCHFSRTLERGTLLCPSLLRDLTCQISLDRRHRIVLAGAGSVCLPSHRPNQSLRSLGTGHSLRESPKTFQGKKDPFLFNAWGLLSMYSGTGNARAQWV